MRWIGRTKIKKPSPVSGDIRYKKRFLVFPKCIKNEWRWLETATWKQEYVFDVYPVEMTYDIGWYDICWIDDDQDDRKEN